MLVSAVPLVIQSDQRSPRIGRPNAVLHGVSPAPGTVGKCAHRDRCCSASCNRRRCCSDAIAQPIRRHARDGRVHGHGRTPRRRRVPDRMGLDHVANLCAESQFPHHVIHARGPVQVAGVLPAGFDSSRARDGCPGDSQAMRCQIRWSSVAGHLDQILRRIARTLQSQDPQPRFRTRAFPRSSARLPLFLGSIAARRTAVIAASVLMPALRSRQSIVKESPCRSPGRPGQSPACAIAVSIGSCAMAAVPQNRK